MNIQHDPLNPREWLESRGEKVIVAYAARNALRALSCLGEVTHDTLNQIALPVLRATLIASVGGQSPSRDIAHVAKSAGGTANDLAQPTERARVALFGASATTGAVSGASAAVLAAARAADTASTFGPSSARSAETAATFYFSAVVPSLKEHERTMEDSRKRPSTIAMLEAEAAASNDAETALAGDQPSSVFNMPLWPGSAMPEGVAAHHDALRAFFASDGNKWGYWERWYAGFAIGQPLDWALQKRIALIPDEEWVVGPVRIAELIRSFELGATPSEDREPEFEPTDVDRLLRHRQTTALLTLNLIDTIDDVITRFHAETGLNQLPEAFAALPGIQGSLAKVTWLLQSDQPDTAIAQQLREQVGRLKARVAELEEALRQAQSGSTSIVAPSFKEQCGKSLGDWKLFAALVGGLWFISGEDVQMMHRLENLRALRTSLFGDVCPLPKPAPIPPLIHDI